MAPDTRRQQREQTRARIRDESRRLFATQGYDRTSIRQIAAGAGVDPALVLHYGGSKQALFRESMGEPAGPDESVADPVEFVLGALTAKLGDRSGPAMTQLRSMLTNPDAYGHARAELGTVADSLAARLTGSNRQQRAQLLLAMNLGVVIVREMLEAEPLAVLTPDEIAEHLRPAVSALTSAD